jgi:hypothetical protein
MMDTDGRSFFPERLCREDFGLNAESQRMDTWRQGIPATYGRAKAAVEKRRASAHR